VGHRLAHEYTQRQALRWSEPQGQPAQRVKGGSLGIGRQGVPGVTSGGPERQAAGAEVGLLEYSIRVHAIREVAGGERAEPEGYRPIDSRERQRPDQDGEQMRAQVSHGPMVGLPRGIVNRAEWLREGRALAR